MTGVGKDFYGKGILLGIPSASPFPHQPFPMPTILLVVKMQWECKECKKAFDEKDIVMITREDSFSFDFVIRPYCKDCYAKKQG